MTDNSEDKCEIALYLKGREKPVIATVYKDLVLDYVSQVEIGGELEIHSRDGDHIFYAQEGLVQAIATSLPLEVFSE